MGTLDSNRKAGPKKETRQGKVGVTKAESLIEGSKDAGSEY